MDFVPSLPTLLTFAAACMLLTLTPGPDMTLQIGRALKEGRTAAFMVLLGTNIGLVIHTVLVAFGISALIVASPAAFFVLKTGGAAYLLWLAFHAIRKGSNFVMAAEAGVERRGSHTEALLNGFWVNLLNPKAVVFFLAFIPQFIRLDQPQLPQYLIFAGTTVLADVIVMLGVYAVAARPFRRVTRTPRGRRTLNTVFGVLFIGIAVLLLFLH